MIAPIDPPYIVDGTEIFIQRPSNLATQKPSYSDYKSYTTVKYLVAIDTFTGVIVYISPGFSGNSSDRFTIQHSEILDELKPGLADKGYNARDLFAQKRRFLIIPSFLSDGRLTAQEGMQSRTIASARIRVENTGRSRVWKGTLLKWLKTKKKKWRSRMSESSMKLKYIIIIL